jgi:hypothetical protein
MTDLRHLESVFEIGFAIHFAYPLLQEIYQHAIADEVRKLKDLDLVTGIRVTTWASFDSHVKAQLKEVENLAKITTVLSLLVAFYAIAIMIYIGFRERVEVSVWVASMLLAIALVPMPCFVILIRRRAKRVAKGLEPHYEFFLKLAHKYNLTKAVGPSSQIAP